MGEWTPNRNLYKPAIGETGWGDKVNQNWDILDAHDHVRSEITDFFSEPFWDNIPDKPSEFPPASHTHEISDITNLADKLAGYDTQIDKIKKDVLTIALNVMMNKALLHAETKDFYSVIADVITAEYPYGFRNTFETVPSGVTFDNDGGGTWMQAIKITLTTVPSEYAQYKIVIQSNTMQIYSADGTLKADYGASTGVASDFWDNVKSDGSDIRIANQDYAQLYFWIEEWDYANSYAVIWVKLEAGTSELYIAYGNPSATKSSYEDGEQVFETFDDFEDGDVSDWNEGSISTNAYEGNYAIQTPSGTGTKAIYKTVAFSDLTELIVEGYVNSAGGRAGIGALDENLKGYIGGLNPTGYLQIYAEDGTILAEKSHSFNANQYYFMRVIFKAGGTVIVECDGDTLSYAGAQKTYTHLAVLKANAANNYYDLIKVLKLADPADFGTAEVITLTTTGDYITVTFDFSEGVDKLLITVDTDAQAIYYSTDDGATWNAIEPDTETLLSETAYSIKWKFEFATYVRGYAFITW